jgi:hypothetical protein
MNKLTGQMMLVWGYLGKSVGIPIEINRAPLLTTGFYTLNRHIFSWSNIFSNIRI